MRYAASHYAEAFAELAPEAKTASAQSELVKNFWAAVEKNGDLAKAPKIIAETEKLLRRADGRDLYEVETARKTDTSVKTLLTGVVTAKDVVRETVNPSLVAGVRITKNGSEQLDVSLKTRLARLFSH
jgi:F0F1-type ATP synthase delta subunit